MNIGDLIAQKRTKIIMCFFLMLFGLSCEIYCRVSLISISQKNLRSQKKGVLRYLRSETDDLRFIIRSKQEIVRQNVSLEWKIVEFDMCRRRKIWIVASKFLYAFTIILQSWMITIIVEISVIFWKLGFWGCSNLALLQDQTLQVHNQTSSIDKALYVRVGHRNSLNWSGY